MERFNPKSDYHLRLIKDYQKRYGQVKGRAMALKEISRIGNFTIDFATVLKARKKKYGEFNGSVNN